MVEIIIANPIYSDDDIKNKEGHWFDKKDMKILINFDADIKKKTPNGLKTIAIFRKKFIKPELNKLAFEAYHKAALPSRGRGAAAGLIQTDSVYWNKRIPVNIDKWSTSYIVKGKKSKMKVNNQVASNVIGFYEATPFLNLPPRMTNYTRTHLEKVKKGLPYLEKLNEFYEKHIPSVYNIQKNRCNKRKELKIPNTVFSTITVNRNFRTGLHRDAGNFDEGYAVMSVLERGKYRGGYTLFPQYGIGFDIREGDCIVFDNTKEWHCNTDFIESKSDRAYNEKIEDIYKDNPEVGTAGLDKKFTRISFVAYLRQKILDSPRIKHDYLIGFNNHNSEKYLKTKKTKTKKTKTKKTKTKKTKK